MNEAPLVASSLAALALGARHGLDCDHLSAIADLVGVGDRRGTRGLGLAFWYCLGHGAVILLLGVAVAELGVRLPAQIDRIFEAIVGATLLLLGSLVLWQVALDGAAYRFTSRWRLFFEILRRFGTLRTGAKRPRMVSELPGRAAFGIGVLHGTGAETPTQVVLFTSAAAVGAAYGGTVIVLLAFVAGLIFSDVTFACFWAGGRLSVIRVPGAHRLLGAITGLSSLVVGTLLIVDRSSMLPSMVGG